MTKLTNCLISKEASESCTSRSPEPNFPKKSSEANGELCEAINAHLHLEKASFHTPGHKGRADAGQSQLELRHDVTELPGLDDLSHPQGVLAKLSKKASTIWNTQSSLISVNGASACLIAAILSVSARGKKVLVPRNAHRAVITGLVLSGLEPVWYSPEWNSEWNLFEHVAASTLQTQLGQLKSDVAAVIVVSPTYAGAITDITACASACAKAGVALIVDEAHGAHLRRAHLRDAHLGTQVDSIHLSAKETLNYSAVDCGADVVVHSLHKTLGAMTQTGIVHLPAGSSVQENDVAFNLNMMQSSSPSYPLLLSIENALLQVPADSSVIDRITSLAQFLRTGIDAIPGFKTYDTAYGTDSWHVLIAHSHESASTLLEHLIQNGVYAECQLGYGALLLLGVGTIKQDIDVLLDALRNFEPTSMRGELTASMLGETSSSMRGELSASMRGEQSTSMRNKKQKSSLEEKHDNCTAEPAIIVQSLPPRIAALAPSLLVPLADAENLIAAECIAPCPPGIPVCVPGQRLTKEVLNKITKENIRVVSGIPPA